MVRTFPFYVAISGYLAVANASPVKDIQPCIQHKTLRATAVQDYVGPPTMIGRVARPGGELTLESSYSIAVTIDIGLGLGLEVKALAQEAGLSVGITTETAHAEGVSYTCPSGSDWRCSLYFRPHYKRVRGFMDITTTGDCSLWNGPLGSNPVVVDYPRIDALHIAIVDVSMCTCHNMKHWADPGHYAELCPLDCL